MTVHPILRASVLDILERFDGDVDEAIAFIRRKDKSGEKTSIRDAMEIWQTIRATARYEQTNYPDLPAIFNKKRQGASDEIWEGRHHWTNRNVVAGAKVTRLDTNAAYLSAYNTHLPIGALEHGEGPEGALFTVVDGKKQQRSGVYLITPPEWTDPDLPNPLGNREEKGKLWVTRPTLVLLQDAAARWDLCGPTVIHEHWTSGSTENLLKDFKQVLVDARTEAIKHDDDVLLEYVKAMYSKFVSTMGQSTSNRDIRRQDWMHIIRAQAFSNLWRKAQKAYEKGMTVYHVAGTDELHLVGEWRTIWKEGRGLGEMKLKSIDGDGGVYEVGAKR